MTNLFLIIIAALLVVLNAFFVAAEFGMVKLRNTRIASIKKTYGFRGNILAYIHQHLDAYLSACQLGITLASLGLGWVGEPAFAKLFVPVFELFDIASPHTIEAISFAAAFISITFLHIIIGELIPKSIAIRQAETVSIWTAVPLYIFYWMMYPIIWFMNACANALLQLTTFGKKKMADTFYSTEELKLIFSSSYKQGELTKEEKKILEHTLDLTELKVTDVMRPAEEMVALDINAPIQESLETVMKHRYSRYPLYDKTRENIVGIVHVKDIYSALFEKRPILNITMLMRPVLKVTRRLPAIDLLRKLRGGMPHFALVYSSRDENLIGFVTLDNLLHVLVGRIQDEFHRTRDDWVKNDDGSYTMPGNASIYSLERALDIDIEAEELSEDVDTLSGVILSRLETLPKVGERVQFQQFSLVVESMRGTRVIQVRIYPAPGVTTKEYQ